MQESKIAFYDSGVGLLSVLAETKKILPLENFIIYADQINNPYGEKSERQIKKFSEDATRFLISKHNIKMMVLACNTATVLALGHLRKEFQIPIVGVVPAIKPAAEKSKNKKIAIMSTPATAKSLYLKNLIKLHGDGAKVLRVGCSGLEEAIEVLNSEEIKKYARKYCGKINEFSADTVVLGCTHYPLIKPQLKTYLKKGTVLVDSGQAVAKRIKTILKQKNLQSSKRTGDIFYTTANPESFSQVASRILKSNITAKKANLNYD